MTPHCEITRLVPRDHIHRRELDELARLNRDIAEVSRILARLKRLRRETRSAIGERLLRGAAIVEL